MRYFRPQHPGIIVMVHEHHAHKAKKLSKKPDETKDSLHSAFWSFITIPLVTVAGITVGKLIEKRKAAS
jgi:hypothetical protein